MLANPGPKNKFICSKIIKYNLIIFEHINLFLSAGLARSVNGKINLLIIYQTF